MRKIKVHIADDHQVLIDGIKAVLKVEDSIEVAGDSLNGEDVVSWFKKNQADVLVLDINMPLLDGFEVLKTLKEKHILPNTVVLSSYDDVKIVKEVLRLGAKGFVAKNAAAEQIVEAIKIVDQGKQYFSKTIKDKVVNSFFDVEPVINKNKSQSKEPGILQMISDRERAVLVLIAEEYSTKEIAERLNIASSTVESHRANLLKKLNLKSSVGLTRFALKNKLTV